MKHLSEWTRQFGEFLFPSTPAIFHSDYSLVGSAERLRRGTVDPYSNPFEATRLEGSVSVEHVRLSRLSGSLIGIQSRPHFYGSFQQTEQGTVLVGRFTASKELKAFTWFGLVFGALFTVLAIFATLQNARNWVGIAIGLGLLAYDINRQRIGHRYRRDDIPWLSQTIAHALTASEEP